MLGIDQQSMISFLILDDWVRQAHNVVAGISNDFFYLLQTTYLSSSFTCFNLTNTNSMFNFSCLKSLQFIITFARNNNNVNDKNQILKESVSNIYFFSYNNKSQL
jgi:hypothetical protein